MTQKFTSMIAAILIILPTTIKNIDQDLHFSYAPLDNAIYMPFGENFGQAIITVSQIGTYYNQDALYTQDI